MDNYNLETSKKEKLKTLQRARYTVLMGNQNESRIIIVQTYGINVFENNRQYFKNNSRMYMYDVSTSQMKCIQYLNDKKIDYVDLSR